MTSASYLPMYVGGNYSILWHSQSPRTTLIHSVMISKKQLFVLQKPLLYYNYHQPLVFPPGSHGSSVRAWPRGGAQEEETRRLTLLRCCYRLSIARLLIMAASKPVEPQSGAGLPRWQLALLVGTPIVLGVGAVYLWNRSRTKERRGKGSGERKTPEGSASPVQGQDGAARAAQELENMVVSHVPPFLNSTPSNTNETTLGWRSSVEVLNFECMCHCHGSTPKGTCWYGRWQLPSREEGHQRAVYCCWINARPASEASCLPSIQCPGASFVN